jgi:uncharacterized protein (DUF849 family)
MLQAALNGARTAEEHPAIPRTPEEVAAAARAAVDEGADVVHVHAYDEDGVESRAAGPNAVHGDGVASWAVSERGWRRGHGIRTGLEDTVFLPDGRLAADNAELVRIACAGPPW